MEKIVHVGQLKLQWNKVKCSVCGTMKMLEIPQNVMKKNREIVELHYQYSNFFDSKPWL
jgi:uncharacterized Fe-S cluster-containing protein